MSAKGWLVAVACTALVLSLVRPEYSLALVIAVVLCLLLIFRERRRATPRGWGHWNSHEIRWVCGLAVLLPLAVATVGLPGWTDRSGRGLWAFEQHYALHWVDWHHSTLNPWTNSRSIFQRDFGPAQSMGAALWSNPRAFAHHVGANLWLLMFKVPYTLIRASLPETPFTFANLSLICSALGLLGALALAISYWRHRLLWHELRPYGLALAMLSLTLLPVVLVMIFLYPRPHYLAMIYPGFLFVLAVLLNPLLKRYDSWAGVLGLSLVALLWVIGVRPAATPAMPRENLQVIRYLEKLRQPTPCGVLDFDGGYAIYLPGHEWIDAGSKRQPFAQYVQTTQVPFGQRPPARIDAIVCGANLLDHPLYARDPTWQAFLAAPEKDGFARHAIAGTAKQVFIRIQGRE